MDKPRLLVSDIDGTLLDHGTSTAGLTSLRLLLAANRDCVRLVYATGRSFSSTMRLIGDDILPMPDGIAPFVGTQAWLPPWTEPNRDYARLMCEDWDRATVLDVVKSYPKVKLQPDEYQSEFKASFYCHDPAAVARLERSLLDAGLQTNVVYSCGKYLDVLPKRAGKRQAVEFFSRLWNVERNAILTCGDSGNDLDMLTDPRFYGVAVGNAEDDLLEVLETDTVHASELPYAAGVLEGAEAFEFWPPAATKENAR